jgi:hypothetical protein
MGSPRPPKSPNPEEKPKARFNGPPDAMKHLLKRRTQAQIEIICASAGLGYAVAQAFRWMHRNQKWLLSGSYLKSPPKMPEPLAAPGPFTSRLNPFMSIVTSGQEVLNAFVGIYQAGARLQAATGHFYEKHPWVKERPRLWQSELRLTCAFAMYAVEVENMGPKLSSQEMEAVALLLGIRPPDEEFEKDLTSNEKRQDGWKEMMKNARADVLPILRRKDAEAHAPDQNAGTPLGALKQPRAVTPSTKPTPAKNSQGARGDKK